MPLELTDEQIEAISKASHVWIDDTRDTIDALDNLGYTITPPDSELIAMTALRVGRYPPLPAKPKKTILEEARELTDGDRQHDYGSPEESYARIAAVWTELLRGKLAPGQSIEASDFPLCMAGMKLVRESYKHKRDHPRDIAGYARHMSKLAGDEDE